VLFSLVKVVCQLATALVKHGLFQHNHGFRYGWTHSTLQYRDISQ